MPNAQYSLQTCYITDILPSLNTFNIHLNYNATLKIEAMRSCETDEQVFTARYKVGRYSSVGIATGYGLGGPGIQSWWRRDFPHPSWPVLGPTQPPVQWVQDHVHGVKRAGRVVNHPTASSAEAKERTELYLYSPSEPSRPVLGWPLPLPLTLHISP